ncbi:MAG TPA: SxtJ family membrane protein [Thermoanaerobaculia bacterium]
MIEINRNPSPRELRQFAMIWLPAAVIVLGAMARWRFHSPKAAIAIWAAGGALALIALFASSLRKPLYIGWMTAVYPIGWTISHLMLLILFYLLVTPFGLLMRIKRDPMERKFDRSAKSYWIPRERKTGPSSYFHQY